MTNDFETQDEKDDAEARDTSKSSSVPTVLNDSK